MTIFVYQLGHHRTTSKVITKKKNVCQFDFNSVEHNYTDHPDTLLDVRRNYRRRSKYRLFQNSSRI
jgi:hypothetical protein